MAGSPQLAILALNEISKLLARLSEQQLIDLVEGRAVVEFRTPEVSIMSRTPKKAATPRAPKQSVDLDEVILAIKGITEEDEVERYLLGRDKELSLADLREIATRIGPPVSAKGTKVQLRKNIAAGTAGLLNRPASAFGRWGV